MSNVHLLVNDCRSDVSPVNISDSTPTGSAPKAICSPAHSVGGGGGIITTAKHCSSIDHIDEQCFTVVITSPPPQPAKHCSSIDPTDEQCFAVVIMSPQPNWRGGGHISFGADPVVVVN